jgi:hypothetical protein
VTSPGFKPGTFPKRVRDALFGCDVLNKKRPSDFRTALLVTSPGFKPGTFPKRVRDALFGCAV